MIAMKKVVYPDKLVWVDLCKRPVKEQAELNGVVQQIFEDVIVNGDEAVLCYTKKFDNKNAQSVRKIIPLLASIALPDKLKDAIGIAAKNIETFHAAQSLPVCKVETMNGVVCWRENRGIERVGIYIPGGSAPLFSTVLMLAIPARLAGCKEVVLCTPMDNNGEVNQAILYAAALTGVSAVYTVGGVQAIAAMAVGTTTIPKVDKIFGPGNQYVTAAKSYAQRIGVAIDMPAGPSEVLLIADCTADPAFLASDILSQAEHGEDSQAVLLSDSEEIINATFRELEVQIKQLPRKVIAGNALANSVAVLLKNVDDCIAFSNVYAPEHLILVCEGAMTKVNDIINAGSVFIGKYSCESAGDYASGTNHTLPTNGYARSYSSVSLDSFVKKITFQHITAEGIAAIGPAIEIMAEAEGLQAHKEAVSIRLKQLNKLTNDANII